MAGKAKGAVAEQTINDLAAARAILDEFLVETEGEETPEIAALWERLQLDINHKIEAWGLWRQRVTQENEAIALEIKRLQLRKQARENRLAQSMEFLATKMRELGVERVDGALATVAFQKNPARVDGNVPEVVLWRMAEDPRFSMFVRVKEEIALDRARVKEYLEASPEPLVIPVELTTEEDDGRAGDAEPIELTPITLQLVRDERLAVR